MTINWGVFLNNVISFLVVAIAVFILVKGINNLKRQEEAAPPPPPDTKDCQYCASSIPIKATRCPNCTSELAAA